MDVSARGSGVEPLRVLFVNENLGGHATMHRALAESLRGREDVAAEFLDVPRPGVVRRIAGAQVPGLARLDADLQPLRYGIAQSLQTRRLLERWLRDRRVDVIHAYSQNAVLLSVAELGRYPSVVSTDSTASQNAYRLPYRMPGRFTEPALRLGERVERRVFHASTFVVAQSEWAARSIHERYALADDRLRVIRFGIVPFDLPERRSQEVPELTFVGTTMIRKGGNLLLSVFREALRDRCTLNLVTREPVEPEPGVRVFGDIRPGDPRLVELLGRTAVFVFPSTIDQSPYSVVEAMMAGVPVVAFRAGAIPEMVIDGETGLVVEPSRDALLGGIRRLLDDEALRQRMGNAGRERAVACFDAEQTTEQLVQVLEAARARFETGR